MHGFGSVAVEDGEPFRHDWERRMWGLRTSVLLGHGVPSSVDESRYEIEKLPPAEYLASGYFERWLVANERIYVRHGLLTDDELRERSREVASAPADPELAERVLKRLRSGVPTRRTLDTPPRFAVGDAVAARTVHTRRHTRLPRYLRGRRGIVEQHLGAFDLPEAAAEGGHEPQHVYSVAFDAHEVWGESAEPNVRIFVQLWESYLEAG
jgi:nitrile hydratase